MEQSYKEKYEQAIERLKQWDREHPCAGYVLSDRDKFIFPELEESEDEKVRKALLELVHDTTGDELWVDYNVHKENALAWLEKQGKKRKITHEEICKSYGIPDIGEFSDGYHTFNGLYKQRMILFAVLVKTYKDRAWKSWKHEDGLDCFGGGWFIVGIDTPAGTYTYHYEAKDWDRFDCQILKKAKHWDGHDESDVERLFSLVSNANKDEVIRCLINGMKFYYEDNEEATWGTEKFSMKVKDILAWLERQGEVKESTISQHENRTCEENGNSLTYEDERIRKAIKVCLIYCNSINQIENDVFNDCIAWLEKQAEQKTVCSEEKPQLKEGKYYKCIKSYHNLGGGQYWFDEGKVYFCEKDGYLRSDPNNLIKVYDCKNWQSYFRPYTENPAWSEEDVRVIDDIFYSINEESVIEGLNDRGIMYALKDIRGIVRYLRNWLQSLKNRVQPKQEWSEEDKDYYDAIIAKLEVTQEDAALTDNQMDFLKSLRPQNRWKPSDEQISLLQAIINEPNNAASESCQIVLKDILEQLKKN